jgi:hypothetical protein
MDAPERAERVQQQVHQRAPAHHCLMKDPHASRRRRQRPVKDPHADAKSTASTPSTSCARNSGHRRVHQRLKKRTFLRFPLAWLPGTSCQGGQASASGWLSRTVRYPSMNANVVFPQTPLARTWIFSRHLTGVPSCLQLPGLRHDHRQLMNTASS